MTMSAEEVRAALETIGTSYSYEPDRWMPSYEKLRALQHEQREQLKPYIWIRTLFICLGFAFVGLALWFTSSHHDDNVLIDTLYGGLPFAAVALMPFGNWLMFRVAARRHPLLIFKDYVEAATRRTPQPYKLSKAPKSNA
jgi:hypothetical protein